MSLHTETGPEPEVAPSELALFGAREYVPPRANLLPPEIAQRAALRRIQAAFGAAVVACGVVVGGAYVMASHDRGPAKAALAQAQAEQTTLQGQANSLAPSQVAHQRVLAAKKSLEAAMGSEILWSGQLDEIRQQLPDSVRLSTLTVAPATDSGSSSSTSSSSSVQLPNPPAGTSTSPASGSGTSSSTEVGSAKVVATVTMTGVAVDHDAVAAWLTQLADIKGWASVYLTSTSRDSNAGLLTYTVTANVTDQALSHRYTNGS